MVVMPRPATLTETPVRRPDSAPETKRSDPVTVEAANSVTPPYYGCTFDPLKPARFRLALKRTFDFFVASCLLVVLAPVFVIVALLVLFDSGGPIFFGQSRVGRNMRVFRMWKFRSMCVGAHQLRREVDPASSEFPLLKVVDDPRATRIGGVLRRWSLDELPQLWNVVRGDISLVGPRPRLPEEVRADGLRQSLRLCVRPGVTGLWQVSGRSELPYADGIALDLGYVRNWSFALDLRILAKTPWAILSRKGAH
jgi:lipopolysaccharide/colanic/teichoic acid biosynthesis glycosyltransferase